MYRPYKVTIIREDGTEQSDAYPDPDVAMETAKRQSGYKGVDRAVFDSPDFMTVYRDGEEAVSDPVNLELREQGQR